MYKSTLLSCAHYIVFCFILLYFLYNFKLFYSVLITVSPVLVMLSSLGAKKLFHSVVDKTAAAVIYCNYKGSSLHGTTRGKFHVYLAVNTILVIRLCNEIARLCCC